jgi:hypothetical protein
VVDEHIVAIAPGISHLLPQTIDALKQDRSSSSIAG